MRCRQAERWLTRSADRPLDPSRREALDRHQAACASCRAFAARLALVRTTLAAAPAVEPLPYFIERLRARIEERTKASPSALWLRWSVRAVPVSLLLIGFFVGAIAFMSPAVEEDMSPPEALLLRNANPLSETNALLDEKAENKSLMVIFAANEIGSARRQGP